MINLDIQLNQFTFLLLDKSPDAGFRLLGNLSGQYPKSVLRNENYMILAVPYRL